MAHFADIKDLDLETIVPRKKMDCYPREFARIKSSNFLRRLMYLRMHFNRVIQSVFIILSNPFIWYFVFSAFINSLRRRKVLNLFVKQKNVFRQ